jgi:hypothetical protein
MAVGFQEARTIAETINVSGWGSRARGGAQVRMLGRSLENRKQLLSCGKAKLVDP